MTCIETRRLISLEQIILEIDWIPVSLNLQAWLTVLGWNTDFLPVHAHTGDGTAPPCYVRSRRGQSPVLVGTLSIFSARHSWGWKRTLVFKSTTYYLKTLALISMNKVPNAEILSRVPKPSCLSLKSHAPAHSKIVLGVIVMSRILKDGTVSWEAHWAPSTQLFPL